MLTMRMYVYTRWRENTVCVLVLWTLCTLLSQQQNYQQLQRNVNSSICPSIQHNSTKHNCENMATVNYF